MPSLALALGLPFTRPGGGGGGLQSLAVHAASEIDSLIAGKNPATDKAIFSAMNHGSPAYTRSTSCWASTLDLTPISPWNSDGVSERPCIAISPRHVLFATHYMPAVSSTIRFVTADNTVVDRTLSDIESLTAEEGSYPDLSVGLLSSDLPSSIAFAKVLPSGWEANLPYAEAPLFYVDQEAKALVNDLYSLSIQGTKLALSRAPTDETRLGFYEALVSGDSGHPACLVINGELVVVTAYSTGGGGSGTSVAGFVAALNGLMTTLGGGYQLTEADLSGFISYEAPATPTIAIDSVGDSEITVSWTGTFDGYIYIDGVRLGVLRESPAVLTDLVNFVEIDIQVKAADGLLESGLSNTVSAYPTFGPVVLATGNTNLTVPEGTWTLSSLFFGTTPSPLPDGTQVVYDSGFYVFLGEWLDATTEEPSDPSLTPGESLLFQNLSGSAITIWTGTP